MLWVPAASDEVFSIAVPLVCSGIVPKGVVPSLNATLPVGAAPPCVTGATAAVKLTGSLRFGLVPQTLADLPLARGVNEKSSAALGR